MNRFHEWQKHRSLRAKFFFLVLPPIFLSFFLFTIITTYIGYKDRYKEAIANLIDFAEVQGASLSVSLWQLNYEFMDDHLKSLLLYPLIARVEVKDIVGEYQYAIGIDVQNDTANQIDLLVTDIVFSDSLKGSIKVGTLSVYYYSGRLKSEFYQSVTRNLIFLFLLIFSIVVSIWAVYTLFILNPLNKFLTSIELTDSENIWNPVEPLAYDEIGKVVIAYNKLIENLIQKEKALYNSQNELEKAKMEAEAANEAKSLFLANMSHEIRTPLNAVIGLGKLLTKTVLDDKQKNYTTKIQHSSIALLGIINDILDFSKIEAGKLEIESKTFQFNEIFDTLTDIFGEKIIGKNIEIIYQVDPTIPHEIIGDIFRLNQVLINLISNALKFTNDGEIVLSARNLKQAGRSFIIEFNVQDSGIGIPPDKIKLLFDSFTQVDVSTSRKYGGTGLGLTICKRLVELMGGEISAESIPHKGTLFKFTTQLKSPESETPNEMLTLLNSLPNSLPNSLMDIKIIIIDDNQIVTETLADMLHNLKIHPIIFHSGNKAVDFLKNQLKNGTDDILILLDSCMPDMDGITFVETIKAIPAIPPFRTIMMTGFGNEKIQKKAISLGVETFLNKPILMNGLVSSILKAFNMTTVEPNANPTKPLNQPTDIEKRLRGTKVLLVEDNEINQQVAQEILEGIGIHVLVANNGLIATRAILKVNFDVILMDVQMPVMDGYEATKKIRENPKYKNIPIIAMTAHALKGYRETCIQAGMNDYVSKPFEPSVLFQKIADVLNLSFPSDPIDDNISNNKIEAESQQFQDLNLPGIDADSAIKRFRGNHKLFLNMLNQFYNEYYTVEAQILEMLSELKFDFLYRLIHSLKGMSGNMSFYDVYKKAGILEEHIQKNQTQALKPLMGDFIDALNVVFASIEIIMKNHGNKEEKPFSEIDSSIFEALIGELTTLIKNKNENATLIMKKIKHYAPKIYDLKDFEQIEASIVAGNFEKASQSLKTVTDIISIDL